MFFACLELRCGRALADRVCILDLQSQLVLLVAVFYIVPRTSCVVLAAYLFNQSWQMIVPVACDIFLGFFAQEPL
jgi:hypothetical protein